MAYVVVGGAVGLFWLLAKGQKIARQRSKQRKLMHQYEKLFDVPVDKLRRIQDDIVAKAEAGLKGDKAGLDMLPTYVDILPSGKEQGDYYAIDLGGTNLRVMHMHLAQGRAKEETQHSLERPIPPECYQTENGKLLEFVADSVQELLKQHPPELGTVPVIGFCFSFGFDQTALDNGALVRWTKGFHGRGLVGQDIVGALLAVFKARGCIVEIPAIMNDTVATLVALRYGEPATQIGVILGTGTNAAYQERIERIETLPAGFKGRSESMLINTEWGDFFSDSMPCCEEDQWIDASSVNPGHGRLEKLVSGLYMGEITRRILARFGQETGLFGDSRRLPPALLAPGALGSAAVAAMDEDSSAGFEAAGAALATLGVVKSSARQRRIAATVARLVALRSARVCAAALGALLEHMRWDGASRVVVAIDGSVFCKYAAYRDMLNASLALLLGAKSSALVALKEARDGSIKGAVYLAAAASDYNHAHAH